MHPDVYEAFGQRHSMERKSLEARCKLKVHTETHELSGMVLTIAKGGAKVAPGVMIDPGVTFTMHPAAGGGGFMLAAQTSDGRFQAELRGILDWPAVDGTALKGQSDFDLTFMPDDTVFGGRMHLLPVESGAIAPDLYRAMQEQLGLK